MPGPEQKPLRFRFHRGDPKLYWGESSYLFPFVYHPAIALGTSLDSSASTFSFPANGAAAKFYDEQSPQSRGNQRREVIHEGHGHRAHSLRLVLLLQARMSPGHKLPFPILGHA